MIVFTGGPYDSTHIPVPDDFSMPDMLVVEGFLPEWLQAQIRQHTYYRRARVGEDRAQYVFEREFKK